MSVFDVLRELDEDNDSDFDGCEDDWNESLGAPNERGGSIWLLTT